MKRLWMCSGFVGFLIVWCFFMPVATSSASEVVVALQSDGKSLDPHTVSDSASMHLIENMYSTLLRYKDGTYGEVEPDLAKSYEISEDGKNISRNLFFTTFSSLLFL